MSTAALLPVMIMIQVAIAACCASADTNAPLPLLGSVDSAPAAARWTFGVIESGGRMPFSVEWGGCTTQGVANGLLLAAPGQVATQKAGEPQLPAVATLLHGIHGGSIGVESCVADEWLTYTNMLLAPVSGFEATFTNDAPVWHPVSRPDPRIYRLDAFWPENLVVVQDMWRGTQRLVRVECRLLCYNASRGVLKVARRIDGVLLIGVGP